MGFESARIRRIPETQITTQQTKESTNESEAALSLEEKEVNQYQQVCRRQQCTSYQ